MNRSDMVRAGRKILIVTFAVMVLSPISSVAASQVDSGFDEIAVSQNGDSGTVELGGLVTDSSNEPIENATVETTTEGFGYENGINIDDFEDGDLSEWSSIGAGAAGINESDPISGQYSLEYSDVENGGTIQNGVMTTTDDVPNQPDNLTYRVRWSYFGSYSGTEQADHDGVGYGDSQIKIGVDGSGTAWAGWSGSGEIGQLNTGEVYIFELSNIDYDAQTYTATVYNSAGNEIGSADESWSNELDHGEISVYGSGDTRMFVDDIQANSEQTTVETVESAETNHLGQYAMDVANGTYEVTASKEGYQSETETVTVDGDTTQDFQLTAFDQSIEIDARRFIEHGQDTPYAVIVTTVENGTTDRRGVTDNATVTSANESVVTVNSDEQLLVATSDTAVNQRTHITANYTDDNGNEYETTQNVTVANVTLENIEILPPWQRVQAALSPEGETPNIAAILFAVLGGVFGARVATSFAGLGVATLLSTVAWFGGYLGTGLVMVGLFTALFIGFNMAANIDYTVRG